MTSERLPRLRSGERMWNEDGTPTIKMQRFHELLCQEIEFGRSRMDDIPDVTIAADHAGVVLAGELPRNVSAKRYFLDADVTTSATWSFTVLSGAVTATIGAATGVLNITAIGAAESEIKITSIRGGLALYRKFLVIRANGATPSGTGGGTSADDSTLASIASATHAAISDELTVTVGTDGKATLSAPLTVKTAAASPAGTFEVFGKWQWFDGAAWVDLAAEVASNPDATVEEDAETGTFILTQKGTLDVPASKTGLTGSHKFRLMARNASGTRTMTFTGTASAVGS